MSGCARCVLTSCVRLTEQLVWLSRDSRLSENLSLLHAEVGVPRLRCGTSSSEYEYRLKRDPCRETQTVQTIGRDLQFSHDQIGMTETVPLSLTWGMRASRRAAAPGGVFVPASGLSYGSWSKESLSDSSNEICSDWGEKDVCRLLGSEHEGGKPRLKNRRLSDPWWCLTIVFRDEMREDYTARALTEYPLLCEPRRSPFRRDSSTACVTSLTADKYSSSDWLADVLASVRNSSEAGVAVPNCRVPGQWNGRGREVNSIACGVRYGHNRKKVNNLYNVHPIGGGIHEDGKMDGYKRAPMLMEPLFRYLTPYALSVSERWVWDDMLAELLTRNRKFTLNTEETRAGVNFLLPMTAAPPNFVKEDSRNGLCVHPEKNSVEDENHEKVYALWLHYLKVHAARGHLAAAEAERQNLLHAAVMDADMQTHLHAAAMQPERNESFIAACREERFPFVNYKVVLMQAISEKLWLLMVERWQLYVATGGNGRFHECSSGLGRNGSTLFFVSAAGPFLRLLPWPPIKSVEVMRMTKRAKEDIVMRVLNQREECIPQLFCVNTSTRWNRTDTAMYSTNTPYGSRPPYAWFARTEDDPRTLRNDSLEPSLDCGAFFFFSLPLSVSL